MSDAQHPDEGDRYRRHKERAAQAQSAQSRKGRDIGGVPPIVDAARRDSCRLSFRLFCEIYLGSKFSLGWSDDHLLAIGRIEDAVLRGGLFALAMPRGSGKTTLAEAAVLWAAIYGHRHFVVLIGADAEHAASMLDNIKVELENNSDLMADFPEVCWPIRALDGIANRAKGQLCEGTRTYIAWGKAEIVLATIAGSVASGCRIRARGITGRVRGMKVTLADGTDLRPDLVIPDDPQTDASAKSPGQVVKRMNVLNGALLGLAGPGKEISGVMPVTVIVPGDMADQILDRDKYPQWQGLRTKLVYAWPTAADLWADYARIRADSLRAGHAGREATEFYRLHREEMDAGAKVAWEARKTKDDLSALQHAYNLRLKVGEEAFDAEYQNDPQKIGSDIEELTQDQICGKLNGVARGEVPGSATNLTAYIDVHGKLLYWMVCAWEPDFTGYVIDYRAFPDPGRNYFRMSEAKHTIRTMYPRAKLDAAVYGGLDALVNVLGGQEWLREDGTPMRLDRILVDANWGQTTDAVKDFCRRSQYASLLLPCHGKSIKAQQTPMDEWPRKPGEKPGFHYVIKAGTKANKKRFARHGLLDVNFWKTFAVDSLAVALGDKGGISLFGDDPQTHLLLAHHVSAETRKRTQIPGRIVDEWTLRTEKPDNHLLDCLVGNCVAGSMCGCQIVVPGLAKPKPKKRTPKARKRRVSYMKG